VNHFGVIGLLTKIGVGNTKQLTPRCKQFYLLTNKLLRKQRQISSSKELFKYTLRATEKCTGFFINNKLESKVTAAASLFTRLQLQETKKKKGHRFTMEEKILSLSIYKRSPKCYSLLSNLFTLPCKRTLNIILGPVCIDPGISPIVTQVLKENVKNLKSKER